MDDTYTFTSREIHLLIYSILEGIASSQRSFDFYARRGDMKIAENDRKDLIELKALYKRFLPNLSDYELFI